MRLFKNTKRRRVVKKKSMRRKSNTRNILKAHVKVKKENKQEKLIVLQATPLEVFCCI